VNTVDGPVCICPLGRSGTTCEEDTVIEVARFNDTFASFMAFNPPGSSNSVRSSTTILLVFKPQDNYGLMVYMDKKDQVLGHTRDFLSVGLYDGFVELRYNLGSGTAVIRSAQRATLNVWHELIATRENRAGRQTSKIYMPDIVDDLAILSARVSYA
jgi:coxsackievirus/adenovirus receptor